jgi:hypothetical protein
MSGAPSGWLGRLAAVRGGAARQAAPAAEEASTSAAAAPPAPVPSPGTQAKAEATKKYIENMYRERDKAAVQRLERRRSLEKKQFAQARRPTRLGSRPSICAPGRCYPPPRGLSGAARARPARPRRRR